MKNFEVFFKNNQFIDKLTGKALHFKPNATYTIQGDNDNFLLANVVSTYFNRKRATACNAFTTFYFEPVRESPSLNWIKNIATHNLDFKRKAIMIKDKLSE